LQNPGMVMIVVDQHYPERSIPLFQCLPSTQLVS
jgi:hypothetical protein